MKQWLFHPVVSSSVGFVSVLIYALLFVVRPDLLASPIPLLRAEHLLQQANGPAFFLVGSLLIYLGILSLFFISTLFRRDGWKLRERMGAAGYALLLLPIPLLIHLVFDNRINVTVLPWLSPLCFVFGIAAWIAGLVSGRTTSSESSFSGILKTSIATCLFVLVFFTLEYMQYQSLRVPHGDSGMYEEHLWNLWNGKGFRSQIDDGRLFLGEHFQFFHVFLMPIYLLHPSLPILNLCEVIALASGALAVFLLARQMNVPSVAWPLALGYLLYFPVQYLTLESSWKTFRPETFGSPLLLWALYAIESNRRIAAAALLLFSFTAKEDYAITAAAIGVWILLRGIMGVTHSRNETSDEQSSRSIKVDSRRDVVTGISLAVGSTVFLLWVLLWFIPYFRGGVPHYTAYFHDLGHSPIEVARSLIERPKLLWERLATPRNGAFLFWMMLPLGFLPLFSPARFAVAVPTFGYLMLSSLDALAQPWFHFHGPLIPVLFWATIGAIRNLKGTSSSSFLGWFVCLLCLITGIQEGRSPLSWKFWDPIYASPMKDWRGEKLFEPMGDYWRSVYLPDERANSFAEVLRVVRPSERVAATDYIRSRFTHHAAAFEYPTLKRHISIDDVDVIVIDRKEGWWGREPNNPDRDLLQAIASHAPVGTRVEIRGRPFEIVLSNDYFVVARQIRSTGDQRESTP